MPINILISILVVFLQSFIKQTTTATRSCRTRKCALHVYSPGIVAARHVRALCCGPTLLRRLQQQLLLLRLQQAAAVRQFTD